MGAAKTGRAEFLSVPNFLTRVGPALTAGESDQRGGFAGANLAFAAPEDDGEVLDCWRNTGEFADAGQQRAAIIAGGGESEITAAAQRFCRARWIKTTLIFAGAGERNVHESRFIAGPA